MLKRPGSTEETVIVSTGPGDGNLCSGRVSEMRLPRARAGSGLGCHLPRHFSHSRAAACGTLSRWGCLHWRQPAEPCTELPTSPSSLVGSKGPPASFLSLLCSGTDPHPCAPQVSYSSTSLSSTMHKLKPIASPFWRTRGKKNPHFNKKKQQIQPHPSSSHSSLHLHPHLGGTTGVHCGLWDLQ